MWHDSFNGGAILPKKRAKRSGQERRQRSSGGSRETGGSSRRPGNRRPADGGDRCSHVRWVDGAIGSAGASSQARARPAATGRDQVAEARSSINRKKGQGPARGPAPSAFWGRVQVVDRVRGPERGYQRSGRPTRTGTTGTSTGGVTVRRRSIGAGGTATTVTTMTIGTEHRRRRPTQRVEASVSMPQLAVRGS